MGFLSVLLSDEQALGAETRFYQRMLAMNLEEATAVADEFLQQASLEELGDAVIVPALTLAEQDRHGGRLDDKRQQFIFQHTRMLIEDFAERADELARGKVKADGKSAETAPQSNNREDNASVPVVCIPARDQADEIAAAMVGQLLFKRGVRANVLSSATLAGECFEELRQGSARIVCLTVVPPFGYTHTRYICRRLRTQFPDLKIIAAVLTERDPEELKQRRPEIPADELATSLKQAVTAILSHLPHAEQNARAAA
jgi:hypothetical protein